MVPITPIEMEVGERRRQQSMGLGGKGHGLRGNRLGELLPGAGLERLLMRWQQLSLSRRSPLPALPPPSDSPDRGMRNELIKTPSTHS